MIRSRLASQKERGSAFTARSGVQKELYVSVAPHACHLVCRLVAWRLQTGVGVSLVQKRICRPHAYIGYSSVSRVRWPLTYYVPRFPLGTSHPDLDCPAKVTA
jgi:hypothetical protein